MRMILIQNYGASGTSLLHSFFDSHPQLLTFPSIQGMHFYGQFREFANSCGDDPGATGIEEIVGFAARAFDFLIDPDQLGNRVLGLNGLGEGQDQHCCVPPAAFLDRFRQEFSALIQAPGARLRRTILIAGYRAYAAALGQQAEPRQILVFPFHGGSDQDLADILEDFPQGLRVIHMVRDPVTMVDSGLCRYRWQIISAPPLWRVSPLSAAVHQAVRDETPHVARTGSVRGFHPLHPDLAGCSAAVRLEDLRRAPEPVLRAVAAWCGFDWHPGLLETTCGGRLWWNRPGSKRVAGVDPVMTRSYASTSGFDRWRIAALARPLRRHYRYTTPHPWDGIADGLALLGWLLPTRYERKAGDPFRSYGLFVTHFLTRWTALHIFLLERRLLRWLALRAEAIRAETPFLTDEIEAAARRAAVIARTATGQPEWAIVTGIGRVIGYVLDRRAILDGFLGIRRERPGDWVPLLDEIRRPDEASPR